MRLFTAAQLDAPFSTPARAWHLFRAKALGIVGWRDLHQPDATITGLVRRAEAAADGDLCFDVLQDASTIVYHCEVDPTDRAFFREALLALEVDVRVQVTGQLVADLGHGVLELHPVRALGVLS